MIKTFLLLLTFCFLFINCYAQNCNNWLNTPSLYSTVSIGDLDVAGYQLTVEATINRTAPYLPGGLQNSEGDVVSKHNSPADVNYLLRPNHCSITTSDGFFPTPDVCGIELNKTYHLAMVYDGTVLKFYRDGFLLSKIAATGTLFQNNWNTKFGLYDPSYWQTQFIGYINEVRIWNVARTQAQIRAFMNTSLPSPTTQTGLLGYYTFDNLINKQGNILFNGILNGAANINATNTSCAFIADSCKIAIVDNNCPDFYYKQNICDPLSIQFIALRETPINPKWLFGDGKQNLDNTTPINLYSNPGTYTVKFVVDNPSCTDTISKNIVVGFLKDNIILTPDTTICYGSTKQLITTPSLLDFCWSPTTFLSDANSASPTTNTRVPITYYFTAAIPGNNLIINGDFNGGNTAFTSQYIYANPNITEGQYFVGPSDQAWNALMSNCADHTTGSGNMLLVNGASVPDIGVWNQTVTVLPNTNYAFSTWIESLYPPNPAQLSFSINGSDIGNSITASSTNCVWTQFYTTWNSGNNTTASIAILNKNIQIQGNDFALDDISFSTVTIKRDSVVISIDIPVVKTGTDTIICAGQPVQLFASGALTYNWTPATALSNAGISTPIATPINTTQYIVTGITAKGCSAADTVLISTNPLPVVQRTADTLICNNVTAQLWANGGNTYQWSPAGSLSDPSIANPVASPIKNTIYYVLVTGANNCTAKDSVNISIRPAIIFTVSPPDTTCTNKSVQLSASGGDSYLWSPATMVSNAGIANPLSATGTDVVYTVLIKDKTCNTSKTLSTSLTVLPAPVINITKSNDISCIINTAQLAASGATNYNWSPATGLSDTSISNPVSAPEITTNYIVTGFDQQTKCSATNSVTVLVTKEGEPKFFIPTAFSPNGDGLNECFKVTHFNYLKSVEISIFNRMGNVVFHTTTDNDCWDGTYKGKPLDAGNYVYTIKTQNNCGVFYKKGNLVLIR